MLNGKIFLPRPRQHFRGKCLGALFNIQKCSWKPVPPNLLMLPTPLYNRILFYLLSSSAWYPQIRRFKLKSATIEHCMVCYILIKFWIHSWSQVYANITQRKVIVLIRGQFSIPLQRDPFHLNTPIRHLHESLPFMLLQYSFAPQGLTGHPSNREKEYKVRPRLYWAWQIRNCPHICTASPLDQGFSCLAVFQLSIRRYVYKTRLTSVHFCTHGFLYLVSQREFVGHTRVNNVSKSARLFSFWVIDQSECLKFDTYKQKQWYT
jgi:hypothetical protein